MNITRTVNFLENLGLNNNKIWFENNRTEYNLLREDFYKLLDDIKFSSISFDKVFESYNARKAAYRINRDLRFSKNKTPYKTEFGALFAANKQEKENGYHFHIDNKGFLHIGGGAYLPEKEQLSAIKKKIIEDTETFLEIIYNREFDQVYGGLSREFEYKRIPSEYSNNYELVEYLKLKGFFAYTSFPISKYKNQNLADFITDKFRIVSPLVKYLREVV